jgi:hypothetical protein
MIAGHFLLAFTIAALTARYVGKEKVVKIGVLAFGVIWEQLEFGISGAAEMLGGKTILTQYGLEDTMKDLMFNTAGGIIVALFGEVYLSDAVEDLRQRMDI